MKRIRTPKAAVTTFLAVSMSTGHLGRRSESCSARFSNPLLTLNGYPMNQQRKGVVKQILTEAVDAPNFFNLSDAQRLNWMIERGLRTR